MGRMEEGRDGVEEGREGKRGGRKREGKVGVMRKVRGRRRWAIRSRTPFSPASHTFTAAENRLSQQYQRFLPREGNFKFVTECFFITQRALHVGLLPAVETFSKTASDLGKQIQAKIGTEKLLKDLNAVSESAHSRIIPNSF